MIHLILAVFWAGMASAQTLPAPSSGPVADLAGILEPRTEADIENAVRDLGAATGVELVVLTIRRLSDYDAGPGIEGFATSLFNKWGIGDKDRNDGVLLLVAVDDHKMRIELGKGFPDSADPVAADIISDTLRPAFRASNLSGGIEKGVSAIAERIAPLAGQTDPTPAKPKSTGGSAGFGVVGLGIVAIFGVILWKFAGKFGLVGRKCPECQQRTITRHSEVVKKPTKTSEGKKQVTSTCRNCGFSAVDLVILNAIASSGNAESSSGFGGGSSDGGGASGDW
ncbi:MAG: TPM domain-containing protein [Paracoccaceae bacterium]